MTDQATQMIDFVENFTQPVAGAPLDTVIWRAKQGEADAVSLITEMYHLLQLYSL